MNNQKNSNKLDFKFIKSGLFFWYIKKKISYNVIEVV